MAWDDDCQTKYAQHVWCVLQCSAVGHLGKKYALTYRMDGSHDSTQKSSVVKRSTVTSTRQVVIFLHIMQQLVFQISYFAVRAIQED